MGTSLQAYRGRPFDVCLLGATFATNNLGVNALTDGALRCLFRHRPAARVFVLDYARASTSYTYQWEGGRAAIPVVNMRFSKNPLLPNNIASLLVRALLLRPARRVGLEGRLLRRCPVLARLRETGLAAAVSGGDSFSDIYGVRRFFYVALPQVLVLLMGRPLVLLPQSIGPFRNPLCRRLAAWILRRAVVVYARDREGVRYCDRLTARGRRYGRARFCFDLGFVVEPERLPDPARSARKGRNQAEGTVGMNVSGLLYMGGYTRRNMFGLRTDYPALMAAIGEGLLAYFGVDLLLVPHVLGASNPESDIRACEAITRHLDYRHRGRVSMPRVPYDQRGAKRIVAACDFFVGSRMHSCIAALSQGIPAVGIAYSDKFAGVMDSVGMGPWAIDIRTETAERAVQRVYDAFGRRAELRARLQEVMPRVRNRVLELFHDIGRAAGTEEWWDRRSRMSAM